MTGKVALFAAILIAATLAGCVGGETGTGPQYKADDEKPQDTESTPKGTKPAPGQTGNTLNVTATPSTGVTNATKFILEGWADPDGEVTTFKWKVPKNSIIEDEFCCGIFDYYISLEVLPIGEDLGAMSQWGLYAFAPGAPLGGITASEFTVTTTLALLPTTTEVPAYTGSAYLRIWAEDLVEGQELTFALAGVSEKEQAFGVAINTMFVVATGGTPGVDTIEQLYDGNTSVERFAVAGSGNGFQVAQYLKSVGLSAIGVELTTNNVDITENLPVVPGTVATARDSVFRTDFAGGGYSEMMGTYLGYEAHGTWEATLSVHGNDFDGHSIIAQDWAVPYLLLVEFLALGLPLWIALGDGAGDSFHQLDLVVTNANFIEVLLFTEFDLGMTVGEISGQDFPAQFIPFYGLLGPVPQEKSIDLDMSGDHLVSHRNGIIHTFLGVDAVQEEAAS